MKKGLKVIAILLVIFLLAGCKSKDSNLDTSKLKEDKFEDLSYQVPEAFEKVMDDEKLDLGESSLHFSDYSYDYEKKGSNGKYDDLCSMYFSYNEKSTANSLEEYAKIFHEGQTGETKTINGVEWYVVIEGDKKALDYNYYAKYNNKYYAVTYHDWGSDDLCGKALEKIEGSFRFE